MSEDFVFRDGDVATVWVYANAVEEATENLARRGWAATADSVKPSIL